MYDSVLIQIVEQATSEAVHRAGAWIVCRPGCHECCLGPFDITPLDAARLRTGWEALAASDPDRAGHVRQRALAWRGGEDEPCPALDPEKGTCDLYQSRPVTCRVFGPAIRYGWEGIQICELCFRGATDEQIAACAVDLEVDALEAELTGSAERTTVAECLAKMAGPAMDPGPAQQ